MSFRSLRRLRLPASSSASSRSTGLGLRAAGLIVGLAGGSLALTVVFAALAVWILGLAVPVTASYIISAVMVVPALTQVGVSPVAAHMFIFYYAVLSEVSPPTALAPFAAAAITGGRPFRTMMLTWKYTLPAFLVPFAFTLDPRGLGLLLRAGWADVALSTLTAAAGVAAVAMAFGGRGIGRATVLERVLAGTGGLCLFYAAPVADVAGFLLTALAVVLNLARSRADDGERPRVSFRRARAKKKPEVHFCYRFRTPEGETAMRTLKRHFLLALAVAVAAAGTVPLAQLAKAPDQVTSAAVVATATPATTQAARDHDAQGRVGQQRRRRLLPRQLSAAAGVLAEAREGVAAHQARANRSDGDEEATHDGDHHVPREPQEPRQVQGHLAAPVARRRV